MSLKIIYDMFKLKIYLTSQWVGVIDLDSFNEHGKHYVGLDPRKENHPIYKEQSGFIKNTGLL